MTAEQKDWKHYSIEDLMKEGKLLIGDGYRAKNSELASSGLPFARAGNVNNGFVFDDADFFPRENLARVGTKLSKTGDVVFTSKGTVGRFGFVGEDCPDFVYSPQLCFWRTLDRNLIHDRWLFYWMAADQFRHQMLGVKGQTDMADYVSLGDQRRMQITLPSIAEQRAISAVLGTLDDKIEQNRRTAQALERLARAIFRAWFVDFEPVKAKAAGATSFPSMPQAIFDALSSEFTDLAQGSLPAGWSFSRLSELCTLVGGGTPRRSEPEYWTGDIPWFSVRDAHADTAWVLNTEEHVSVAGIANSAARLLPEGGTIISARGTVGKLAMAGVPMAFNQSCYGVLPNDGHAFVYTHLLLQRAVIDLQQRAHGSVFETITLSTFDGLSMPSPPADLVTGFEEVVSVYFELSKALGHESTILAAIRDYLTPLLLSGRVSLSLER